MTKIQCPNPDNDIKQLRAGAYRLVQKGLFGAAEQRTDIRSVSYNNDEIIRSIMTLYCPKGFDLDPTYSSGQFYKKIPQPLYKFDLKPKYHYVQQADVRKLPFDDNSLNSIMFDPPFLAGISKRGGIMKERFGTYKNIQTDLWGMYHDAIKELHRILKPEGILVFKCQDTIDQRKQYLSHVQVINEAVHVGFYPEDIFILLARARIVNEKKQYHARKYHSYFIVFRKKPSPVIYSTPYQK